MVSLLKQWRMCGKYRQSFLLSNGISFIIKKWCFYTLILNLEENYSRKHHFSFRSAKTHTIFKLTSTENFSSFCCQSFVTMMWKACRINYLCFFIVLDENNCILQGRGIVILNLSDKQRSRLWSRVYEAYYFRYIEVASRVVSLVSLHSLFHKGRYHWTFLITQNIYLILNYQINIIRIK